MATDFLRKDYNVDITVERVNMSSLRNVELNDVLIKDHHADTLVYVHNLTTSILSYSNLINGKLNFGQFYLEKFILNMKTYKGEEDDAFTMFIKKFDDGITPTKPSGFLLTSSRLK